MSTTVGVGTSLSATNWTYNVGNVRRVATIGSSKARGTYLVVQVAATNRGSAGAQLQPSNFSLVAGSGEEYAAQPSTSAVYSSALNPESAYAWPTDFPVGRPVLIPLVFEINPSVAGTQLVILDVPATHVRLEWSPWERGAMRRALSRGSAGLAREVEDVALKRDSGVELHDLREREPVVDAELMTDETKNW